MNRYRPVKLPGDPRTAQWAILDTYMGGYCTVPDDKDPSTLLPLEWRTRAGAEAWLHRCYNAWERGKAPAPKNWRPLPPQPSPWSIEMNPPFGMSTR